MIPIPHSPARPAETPPTSRIQLVESKIRRETDIKHMRLSRPIILLDIIAFPIAVLAQGSLGNGTFQDLNFESAAISPGSPPAFGVPTAQALPGWTVAIGGQQISTIQYDILDTGSPEIALVSPAYGAIDGNFTVVLQQGLPGYPSTSIFQTGIVPAGANSLQFTSADLGGLPISFLLTVNGQALPISFLPPPGIHFRGGLFSVCGTKYYVGVYDNWFIIERKLLHRRFQLFIPNRPRAGCHDALRLRCAGLGLEIPRSTVDWI